MPWSPPEVGAWAPPEASEWSPPEATDEPSQSTVRAAGNALAQEAVKGIGHAVAGLGAASEIMPVMPSGEEMPPEWMVTENLRRARRTPAQTMQEVQANPIYQQGEGIAAVAPETYPVEAVRAQQFVPQAAGMVGGFLPLLASGPAAPVTIGLQSLGAHVDEDWQAAKKEGLSDDAAAARAIERGLRSGGLQAGIFALLPAPLRKAGEKYLVEKFGDSTVKEFIAGRVALGAEGAVLGGTSTAAENLVSGRDITQGVLTGATALGAANLVLPPYLRGSRNRAADAIETELGEKPPVINQPISPTPVPESPATVAAQVAATLDPQSAKAVTLVTPGEPRPEAKGLVSVDTALGEALVNADKVDPKLAKAELDAGRGGQLLGMSTAEKPALNPNPNLNPDLVLETKTPEGVPVQQEVVTPQTLPAAVEAGKAVAPEGTQEVKPAEQILAERISSTPEASPTSKNVSPSDGPSTAAPEPPAPAATQSVGLSPEIQQAKAEALASVRRNAEEGGLISTEDKPALAQAELWADNILNVDPRTRSRTGLDPAEEAQRLAAVAVKGAVVLIKGAKDFNAWSAEMARKHPDWAKLPETTIQGLWDQSKQIATGTHPTIGLSQHGVKQVANEELSDLVREAVEIHYQKLTDESARTIAAARVVESGGPLPNAQRITSGGFDAEPLKIQNAIAATTLRQLALQERGARARGETAVADALADQQIAVAQSAINRSPDVAQGLQSFKLFYDFFTPAAWLKKFQTDVGRVAAERAAGALGKPVEPSPAGVAQGVAKGVAEQVSKRNPKLGDVIASEWGGAAPKPGTLAERLEQSGRAKPGKGKAVAAKISKFYAEEVAKFRKLHKIPAFDEATQRDILARAKKIDALPPDSVQRRQAAAELMDHLRRMKGFDWWELPLDFWYANILSGPVTHGVNATSNAANLAAEVAVQSLRSPTSIPRLLEGLARGVVRGVPEATNILRTGHDTAARHGDKFEARGALEARGNLLLPWKLVGRALKAADVMFFYPLQEAQAARLVGRELPLFHPARSAQIRRQLGWTEAAHKQAEARATAEGLTGNLHRRRVNELIEQARPETLMENARDFAFQGTFNNDVYGVAGALQRGWEGMAHKVPLLKVVVPFTRIITNILNSGMNWTPVGYWRAARAQGLKLLVGRAAHTGKLFGKEITDPTAVGDLYARATLGTAALSTLAMAAGQYVFDQNPKFMVTGSGPANPDQRKLLREAGWIPYSLKVGNRYYSYQNTVMGVPLALVGHYLDAVRYRKLDQADALNRAAFAGSSLFNVIAQGSWLQGLSALFNTVSQDSTKNPLKGVPQQIIRTASSLVVPNALRQLEQLFDPKVYQAEDINAMMLKQIPFARRANQPDLNIFGEPVDAPLSKRWTSKVENDGLVSMLAGRRLWPSTVSDAYLSPAQTHTLLKYRGLLLRSKLQAQYGDIATLPHAEAQDLVSRISARVTLQAKKDLGLDSLLGIERQRQRMGER